MLAIGFRHPRQQQQTIRCLSRTVKAATQLISALHIVLRQRDVDGPDARILRRRILGHQVVIDHARIPVHLAVLVETGHREHQIAVLRILLQCTNQLVIRHRVLTLLPQTIHFVNQIAIANTGQLRRRTARLQFRVAEEALRLTAEARLIQYRHLRGIIARIALHATLQVSPHHRNGAGEIARLRQLLRQVSGINRVGGWINRERLQGIGGGSRRALRQILVGRAHLQIEINPLRQFTHRRRLRVSGNARQQRAGLLPAAAFAGVKRTGIQFAGAGPVAHHRLHHVGRQQRVALLTIEPG